MFNNSDIIKIKSLYKPNSCLIDWILTYWCNYRCPYCIQYSKNKNDFIKENVLVNRALNLNIFLKQNNITNIVLKLIGGEVTYYNLINIIDKIENIKEVVVLTNLSQKLDYFYNMYNYLKERKIIFSLICSKHEQNIDFDSKFIELSNWCKKNKMKDPQLTLVVDDNFDFGIVDNFIQNNITKIKLVRCKIGGAINKPLNLITLDKINMYNEKLKINNNKCHPTISVTFKDHSTKEFLTSAEFTNQLDSGGFIPDDFYCDALSKNSLFIDPEGNIRPFQCKFLRENNNYIYGNLDKGSFIEIGDKCLIKCELTKIKDNFRCTMCNKNSVYKNEEDYYNEV